LFGHAWLGVECDQGRGTWSAGVSPEEDGNDNELDFTDLFYENVPVVVKPGLPQQDVTRQSRGRISCDNADYWKNLFKNMNWGWSFFGVHHCRTFANDYIWDMLYTSCVSEKK